jgi:WD40 repeat protein
VRGYQFWHVGTWEKGPRIEGDSNGALSSFCAAFSPNGNLLAVQQNGDRVSLHDSRDATLLAVLEAPKGIMAELLRFTGDGTKLAVLGANQVIQLWDIPAIRQELRGRGLDWADR